MGLVKESIRYERNQSPRLVDFTDPLGFARKATNYVFFMEYHEDAWQNPRIAPYDTAIAQLGLTAMSAVFHYGQSIFEGLKAFMQPDGEVALWRPDLNAERLNRSVRRMSMPKIPVEETIDAIEALVDHERAWVPNSEGGRSLYVRPFMFATTPEMGVKPARDYAFVILVSPTGDYYPSGLQGIDVLIQYSDDPSQITRRTCYGGTGEAKCGGNYGASMQAVETAKSRGASQVLFTGFKDPNKTGRYEEYLEETAASNFYFVTREGEMVIPTWDGTILRSHTVICLEELASGGYLDISIRREHVSLKQYLRDVQEGKVTEAGGIGTAAVIGPITGHVFQAFSPLQIGYNVFQDGQRLGIGDGQIGPVTRRIREEYIALQRGLRGHIERDKEYHHIVPKRRRSL